MNSGNKISLMITSAGGTLAPAIIDYLNNQTNIPLRIVTVDLADDVPVKALSSAHRVVPMGGDPRYAEVIARIVREESVDVILPWSDEDAITLSPARSGELDVGARVIVSPPSVMERISDKLKTYHTLEQNGVSTPEYTVARTAADIRSAAESYGFPERSVVVKPAKGRGGRGMNILCGKDSPPDWLGSGAREQRLERQAAALDFEAMLHGTTLVMPVLEAPVYDVDILAERGVARAAITRLRWNPTGIPFTGNTILANSDMTAYGKSIAETLQLDSLHDIDIMTTTEGEPRLLEVNPRPSGSLLSSLLAGFPLIEAAVAQALGESLSVETPQNDIEVIVGMTAFVSNNPSTSFSTA